MDVNYQILKALFMFAFGIFLLIFRDAISKIIFSAQKKSNVLIRRKVYDENADREYTNKLTIVAGIFALIGGVWTFLRLFKI